jgi:hypothetical protein
MNDSGEAVVGMTVVGAWLTAAPFVLAATENTDTLFFVAAVIGAITAIGIGVGKVWKGLRKVFRGVDKLEELVVLGDQLKTQMKDIQDRIDAHEEAHKGGMTHGTD